LKAVELYEKNEDRTTLLEKLKRYGEVRDFSVKLKKADGSVFPVSLFSRRIQFMEQR